MERPCDRSVERCAFQASSQTRINLQVRGRIAAWPWESHACLGAHERCAGCRYNAVLIGPVIMLVVVPALQTLLLDWKGNRREPVFREDEPDLAEI